MDEIVEVLGLKLYAKFVQSVGYQ